MMFAWMSATGVVPTISKSKPLPFQRLLVTINRDILKPEVGHRTDFRYPAVFAVERARKRDKGRTPIRERGTRAPTPKWRFLRHRPRLSP